mmetsp:Transcript_30452/g.88862  ORF Transcript_30452/g.88862 Transcript_30452/m.88862 type:complete len:231 (-) Transcript_30452:535-1227(-)
MGRYDCTRSAARGDGELPPSPNPSPSASSPPARHTSVFCGTPFARASHGETPSPFTFRRTVSTYSREGGCVVRVGATTSSSTPAAGRADPRIASTDPFTHAATESKARDAKSTASPFPGGKPRAEPPPSPPPPTPRPSSPTPSSLPPSSSPSSPPPPSPCGKNLSYGRALRESYPRTRGGKKETQQQPSALPSKWPSTLTQQQPNAYAPSSTCAQQRIQSSTEIATPVHS